MEDTFGEQQAKLAAGDMILYPATSRHHVKTIMRGSRWASFFWIQSMVREDTRRTLLYDLDNAIRSLRGRLGEDPAVVQLTGVYHNLIRQWAEA